MNRCIPAGLEATLREEGRKAGEWLANYLETRGRSRETINLVTLQGTLDSSAQLGRTEGFRKSLHFIRTGTCWSISLQTLLRQKHKRLWKDFLQSTRISML